MSSNSIFSKNSIVSLVAMCFEPKTDPNKLLLWLIILTKDNWLITDLGFSLASLYIDLKRLSNSRSYVLEGFKRSISFFKDWFIIISDPSEFENLLLPFHKLYPEDFVI